MTVLIRYLWNVFSFSGDSVQKHQVGDPGSRPRRRPPEAPGHVARPGQVFDHLCRNDPLPDARRHERAAGAHGSSHELVSVQKLLSWFFVLRIFLRLKKKLQDLGVSCWNKIVFLSLHKGSFLLGSDFLKQPLVCLSPKFCFASIFYKEL